MVLQFLARKVLQRLTSTLLVTCGVDLGLKPGWSHYPDIEEPVVIPKILSVNEGNHFFGLAKPGIRTADLPLPKRTLYELVYGGNITQKRFSTDMFIIIKHGYDFLQTCSLL